MSAASARADAELVRRGLARSREHAVTLIAAGRVHAGAATLTKPSQRVDAATELRVEADPEDPGYASRAGYKLAGALAVFGPQGLTVRDRRAVDVGASTGGFTDVLLRAGARHVVCLDVGRDQLVPRLRDDPRTTVLEGCNARTVTPSDIDGPVDLVVVDVSFISLTLVLPAVVALTAADADVVVMVKPQFEVGRERLGSGGVVRDAASRRAALRRVADAASEIGWGARSVTPSPLPGPSGNVEYFLWLRRGPAALSADGLDHAVAEHPDGERVSS